MRFFAFLLMPFLASAASIDNTIDIGLMPRSSAIEFFQAKVENKYDLTQPMRKIIPDIRKIPSRAVESCYESKFNDREFHLFKNSATLFDVLYDYYLTQPEKRPTLESIENLIHSAQSIVEHVNDCSEESRGFKLGFTALSDLSETEFRERLGIVMMEDSGASTGPNSNGTRSLGDPECYPPSSYSPPREFDFRAHNAVTAVKNQGTCGSCWTFSTAATIESAYLIRKKQRLDLSEQQLVDCAYWQGMGGCTAGTSFQGYSFVKNNGMADESKYRYRGNPFACNRNAVPIANIRKFCIRGQNGYGPPSIYENLSDQSIIAALGYFGPVGVYINADRLQNYRSGIVNDRFCSKQVNHAVTLVGYTESSWIIKNSWGTNWGDGGYFQLARGSNMCGVNFEINYPLL